MRLLVILLSLFCINSYAIDTGSTGETGSSTLTMLMMKYSSNFVKTTNDVTFDSVFGGGDLGTDSSSSSSDDSSMTNSTNYSDNGSSFGGGASGFDGGSSSSSSSFSF